jgi:peptidoglycan/LPS O-acetylase OafA/YrhL
MNRQKGASSGTVENIQALRGIAALLVLYAHVRMLMRLFYPAIPGNMADGGGIGVDLFFVISGFVICLTANKRHHSASDFILARIARVVPFYLAATLFHLFLHLIIPVASLSHPTFKSVWNGLFFLPIFDWGYLTTPPIFVGWTLSFEMWFYLMFAFCLLFCKPLRAAALFPLLFALCALAGIWYHGNWYLPRFVSHPFVIEFAFGCVAYQLRHQIRGALPWLLLVAGIAYIFVFSQGTDRLGFPLIELDMEPRFAVLPWLRMLLWGVPMALIVAGLVGLELSRNYTLPPLLVGLGAISYSLYLTHWPVIQILLQITARTPIRSPWIIGPVATVTCLTAATLCYFYVEIPLTKRAQKWAKRLASPRPDDVRPADAMASQVRQIP